MSEPAVDPDVRATYRFGDAIARKKRAEQLNGQPSAWTEEEIATTKFRAAKEGGLMSTKAKPIGRIETAMVAEMVPVFYHEGLRQTDHFGFINVPLSWTRGQVALAKRIHRLLMQAEKP